ncbi:MAG: hypothetical protein V7K42_26880 [Nostoc sp.]
MYSNRKWLNASPSTANYQPFTNHFEEQSRLARNLLQSGKTTQNQGFRNRG